MMTLSMNIIVENSKTSHANHYDALQRTLQHCTSHTKVLFTQYSHLVPSGSKESLSLHSPLDRANTSAGEILISQQAAPYEPRDGAIVLGCRSTNRSLS